MARKHDSTRSPRVSNRRAFHDYHIEEKLEVGVVLRGSEVKSIRNGQVSLDEAYARVEPASLQLFVHDLYIAPYSHAAGSNGHEAKATRKLLAHRRQIRQLLTRTESRGATLVPLALYFVRGHVKIELGVAVGKQHHDKREDIKKREADRDMRRALSKRRM